MHTARTFARNKKIRALAALCGRGFPGRTTLNARCLGHRLKQERTGTCTDLIEPAECCLPGYAVLVPGALPLLGGYPGLWQVGNAVCPSDPGAHEQPCKSNVEPRLGRAFLA